MDKTVGLPGFHLTEGLCAAPIAVEPNKEQAASH